jgi:enoyl-CoA hydratase/carnithine racemase
MDEDKLGNVRLNIDGAVASIVFDRPAARNAMTWTMYEQLSAICERIAQEPAVRVACLRGAGGEAFVAGTDIEQFKSFADGRAGVAYEQRIDAAMARLESLSIATVALVEGWAVGGGLAIATACDIRIATPAARFGLPIARTLGNCLSMASLARLVAAFGRPRVQRMLIGAEVLTADEALACGYLAQVVAPDAITAAGAKLCEQLASLAPVTQAVSKEGLRRLMLQNLPDAQDLIERSYGSEDFREGVRAFSEKRKPVWRGR